MSWEWNVRRIRKDEHIREEAMELAKLRPMWRGAIIRRKEWKSIRL